MDVLKEHLKRVVDDSAHVTCTVSYNPLDKNPLLLDRMIGELGRSRFSLQQTRTFLSECRDNPAALHVVCQIQDQGTTSTITLNVIVRNAHDLPPVLLLKRVLKRVYALKRLLDIPRETINYWLVPCKQHRWFPSRGDVEPKHINGGYTYVSPTCNCISASDSVDNGTCVPQKSADIYLFRYQEFPKVMLHETLHHSRVETGDDMLRNRLAEIAFLKTYCNIDKDTLILPNEAIVETWAIIMHTLFVSLELGLPAKGLLEKEKEWGDRQAQRIVSSISKSKDHLWKEDSNSYCYVVIKAALLHNVDEFIVKSLSTGDGAGTGTCTSSTNASVDMVSYILKALQNKEYLAKRASRRRIKTDSFRMSVYGDL